MISNKGAQLLIDFDSAAQTWGWESDQGYDNERIGKAMKKYEDTLRKLQAYIVALESRPHSAQG